MSFSSAEHNMAAASAVNEHMAEEGNAAHE